MPNKLIAVISNLEATKMTATAGSGTTRQYRICQLADYTDKEGTILALVAAEYDDKTGTLLNLYPAPTLDELHSCISDWLMEFVDNEGAAGIAAANGPYPDETFTEFEKPTVQQVKTMIDAEIGSGRRPE